MQSLRVIPMQSIDIVILFEEYIWDAIAVSINYFIVFLYVYVRDT